MGSFPNMVAGQLLKAIFVTPMSYGTAAATAGSGICSLYGSDNTVTLLNGGGFLGSATAGAQTLYLGLLVSSTAVGGSAVNNILDVNITSNLSIFAGTAMVATASTASVVLLELVDNNYSRIAFAATLTTATPADTATLSQVTLPNASVNFCPSGINTAGGIAGAAVGFFISSFPTKNLGGANRPHVIAYGQLSTAKALGFGDQPTFAAGAITITLD